MSLSSATQHVRGTPDPSQYLGPHPALFWVVLHIATSVRGSPARPHLYFSLAKGFSHSPLSASGKDSWEQKPWFLRLSLASYKCLLVSVCEKNQFHELVPASHLLFVLTLRKSPKCGWKKKCKMRSN